MKLFLLPFSILLFVTGLSQEKKQVDYFIGTWKAVSDSNSTQHLCIQFIDTESLEIYFDTVKLRTKYKIGSGKDADTLTLMNNKTAASKMIIVADGKNVFYLNTIEENKRYTIARNAEPGRLVWGWTDPAPIKFERQ
jgi:hypothetical protein